MNDLFTKCYTFTRADEVKSAGFYPYFRPIEQNEGPVVKIEGREVIMAGSNNYHGLTTHPKVIDAAQRALLKYGTGCSGSRYLTGTLDLHIELELKLAKFLNKESCLLYSTGYQTAQGIIPTLVNKGEYIVSDKDNHASIVAGTLMAKGMLADLVRYKHGDLNDLERVLKAIPLETGKLIATDGVFSTSGTVVELPEIVALCKKYNARLMVDDAHSLGVIGVGGRGTASHFGLDNEVDMIMGTFSKTLASLGGFVAGEERVINFLKHHSPALIFSASPTPSSVAAAIAALDILSAEPERVTRLSNNANKMREGLKGLGFHVLDGVTPIVPVILGNDLLTFQFWRKLYDAGVFVNAFVPPGVPQNLSMLRTSYMATHEEKHLNRILEVFGEIGKEMGVIK
ncbi:MAG: pyridoxal phosphate-dependent aminotransferase family protein [Ignavibacteriae bacterium]|nr:pyridoxal phosphate-dependent aminotransferase family protein [Ignavibacteriota bacterium]